LLFVTAEVIFFVGREIHPWKIIPLLNPEWGTPAYQGTQMSSRMLIIVLLAFIIVAVNFTSCKKDDDSEQENWQAVEAYAGWRDTPNNFDARAYLYAEYKVATDTNFARRIFTGNFDAWKTLAWETGDANHPGRSEYLPSPFTHDIMTTDRRQYFKMIGYYIGQFGYGWKDTYNHGAGWSDSVATPADWRWPSDSLSADNARTVAFDGGSRMFYEYRSLLP
jgi:hypothetical protein